MLYNSHFVKSVSLHSDFIIRSYLLANTNNKNSTTVSGQETWYSEIKWQRLNNEVTNIQSLLNTTINVAYSIRASKRGTWRIGFWALPLPLSKKLWGICVNVYWGFSPPLKLCLFFFCLQTEAQLGAVFVSVYCFTHTPLWPANHL